MFVVGELYVLTRFATSSSNDVRNDAPRGSISFSQYIAAAPFQGRSWNASGRSGIWPMVQAAVPAVIDVPPYERVSTKVVAFVTLAIWYQSPSPVFDVPV